MLSPLDEKAAGQHRSSTLAVAIKIAEAGGVRREWNGSFLSRYY
jgi:hypothetical protein